MSGSGWFVLGVLLVFFGFFFFFILATDTSGNLVKLWTLTPQEIPFSVSVSLSPTHLPTISEDSQKPVALSLAYLRTVKTVTAVTVCARDGCERLTGTDCTDLKNPGQQPRSARGGNNPHLNGWFYFIYVPYDLSPCEAAILPVI